ncbi:MAG: hypothetical protein II222_02455 [Paraprevotella sp.]|nr:hypothetical protein [Paraprevotella sp.]
MKTIINVILAVSALGLLYLCYNSLMEPIQFNEMRAAREAAVKERLIQIREAQEQFKNQNDGFYCDSLHKLIDFVKTAKIAFVSKEGVLTDEQMDKGLTESSAAAIVNSGDAKAIAANGLEGFRRDTTWVALIDSLYEDGFVADSLAFIPFSEGEQFEMQVSHVQTRSGITQWVMECGAKYAQYLKGTSKREIYNLTDEADKMSRYPGLKIGDLYSNNNNAGNWE